MAEERRPGRLRPWPVVVSILVAGVVALILLTVPGLVRRFEQGSPSPSGPADVTTPSADPTPTPTPRSAAPQSPEPTPTAAPRATPTASAGLDEQPMSRAEISADRRSCVEGPSDDPDAFPRQGELRAVYAASHRVAGLDGPLPERHRYLVLGDEAGTWTCVDGRNRAWSSTRVEQLEATADDPAQVAPTSGPEADCDGSPKRIGADQLFRVAKGLSARVRVVSGDRSGRWQPVTAVDGFLHVSAALTGRAAVTAPAQVHLQFLGRDGQPVEVADPLDDGGPTRTVRLTLTSCES